METISVTLSWDGVWEIKKDAIPSDVPDGEGIYMIVCGKKSTEPNKWDASSYMLLYIGEAEKVRTRIEGHEKWSCWEKNCTNHMLLKVAKCELGTSRRQKVECCLVYHTKPICNDECKDSFPHDDTGPVKNVGVKSPLKGSFIC